MMTKTLHSKRWKVTPAQYSDGTEVFFTGHVRRVATADVVLGRELISIVDEHPEGNLYLDFRNVEFLNCADIGRLVKLWKKLKDEGRQLVLCNVQLLVYQVFQIIRLNQLMEIRATRTVS